MTQEISPNTLLCILSLGLSPGALRFASHFFCPQRTGWQLMSSVDGFLGKSSSPLAWEKGCIAFQSQGESNCQTTAWRQLEPGTQTTIGLRLWPRLHCGLLPSHCRPDDCLHLKTAFYSVNHTNNQRENDFCFANPQTGKFRC